MSIHVSILSLGNYGHIPVNFHEYLSSPESGQETQHGLNPRSPAPSFPPPSRGPRGLECISSPCLFFCRNAACELLVWCSVISSLLAFLMQRHLVDEIHDIHVTDASLQGLYRRLTPGPFPVCSQGEWNAVGDRACFCFVFSWKYEDLFHPQLPSPT